MIPLLLSLLLAAPAPTAPEARGEAFWKALVESCTVPAGESAAGLVGEAVSLLGHPDSFWRDDVGYGVVAACVYRERRLTLAERRALAERLAGDLRRGIGESGTDSVLLRSFSALDLSVLAAAELREPALDAAGYRRLLEAALGYLREERDLRGFEPRVGWVHATAHTADLLKFLARDARLAPADHPRLLDAAWRRMTAPGTPVFTHAEDERLAAALLSVVRRPDFEPAVLEEWLARFESQERSLWEASPPDPAALDATQNARNLLRSLHLLLSMPEPPPTAGQEAARAKALATLQRIRR